MQLDRTPIRYGGVYYCSPACGANCTYQAYLKALNDSDALAKRCTIEIGGQWNPFVHENLGWHWHIIQENTNIAIYYGGYLAKGEEYSIGLNGGTPAHISLSPQTFPTPKAAYMALIDIIEEEANKWNKLIEEMTSIL